MKRIAIALFALLVATAAQANLPFFNADCPDGIEVHADDGGPVYINGREANLKRVNDSYYQASRGDVTLTITTNANTAAPLVSYSSHDGHGFCTVKQHGSSYSSNHDRSHHDSWDSDEGVTLFHDYNFRGGSETVYGDIPDMSRSQIGNDALSSIEVPRGCEVTLYSDNNYRGRAITLHNDESELGRTPVGNDSVSSMRVNCHDGGHGHSYGNYGNDGVTLYADHNFRGRSETVYGDIPEMSRTDVGNDALSSIKVPRGCSVTLYEDSKYRGRSVELYGDESEMSRTGVGNDSVSSMRVDCH